MSRVLALAFIVTACPAAEQPAASKSSSASTSAGAASSGGALEPIGEATMLDDGTIVLTLHRPASTQRRIAPTDPSYGKILEHVGPLEKGKSKLVMPWPDEIDDARVKTVVDDYVKNKKRWADSEWSHHIDGTDSEGNVVVTVTHKDDLKGPMNGGGKSFQLRLSARDYAVVRELAFQ